MNATLLTKEECSRELINLALFEIDPENVRAQHACLRGAKELLRHDIHLRRNHASRVAPGLPPFCQPLAKTEETCQPLANAAQAVCQGPANPPPVCQPPAKAAAGAEPWVFAAEED